MPDPNLIFNLINGLVMPAWALLIFLPRWVWTQRLVHSVLFPLLLGSVYLAYMVYVGTAGSPNPDAGFTTVSGVQAIFSTPEGVLIGWSHYLVFDLFVGAWIARDAARRGIKHLWTIPCLLLSFIFGPIGLLLYVILRKAIGKGSWTLFED